LVGVFAVAGLFEGVVASDVTWRLLVTVLAVAVAAVLLWRREHPLLAALLGWGVAGLLAFLQVMTQSGDLGLTSMLAVLILLYSLVRWGSGREIVLGLCFVTVVVTLGMYAASADWAQVFGGSALLLLIIALAAVFRYRADLWARQQVEVRNQERVALARELHDTVAHHVSAIAVQAQAGGVVAANAPEKAAQIFAAIESEASRTLVEMRSMVRLLREDEAIDYTANLAVTDLTELARTDATPIVEVTLHGCLTGLPPAVNSALYRLGQESLTNALRHARGATFVRIDVRRERDDVRLRVTDDGATGPAREPGFGLMGMAERATLLGGSLSAGPRPEGGWVVEAILPA
jgi:signal transduction histidine kinase